MVSVNTDQLSADKQINLNSEERECACVCGLPRLQVPERREAAASDACLPADVLSGPSRLRSVAPAKPGRRAAAPRTSPSLHPKGHPEAEEKAVLPALPGLDVDAPNPRLSHRPPTRDPPTHAGCRGTQPARRHRWEPSW